MPKETAQLQELQERKSCDEDLQCGGSPGAVEAHCAAGRSGHNAFHALSGGMRRIFGF